MSQKKEIIRQKFRLAVFKRDKNCCRICGRKVDCDAHHITDRTEMPNGGYVASNGISLCKTRRSDANFSCHELAEAYYASKKMECHEGFHPDDLYKLIGSSYKQAIEDSEKLGKD